MGLITAIKMSFRISSQNETEDWRPCHGFASNPERQIDAPVHLQKGLCFVRHVVHPRAVSGLPARMPRARRPTTFEHHWGEADPTLFRGP